LKANIKKVDKLSSVAGWIAIYCWKFHINLMSKNAAENGNSCSCFSFMDIPMDRKTTQ